MYGILKGSKKMKIIFWGSSVTYGDDGWSMCEYIKETMKCDVVKWALSGTTLKQMFQMILI